MKKKYNSLFKNLGLFTIGSFGSKLITFLLLPLYTSILSTSDYGKVDIIQTVVSLLIPILLLSIQDATLRFSMDNNYKKSDVISTTLNVIFKGTLILIFGIMCSALLNIFKLSFIHYLFLLISFLFNSLNNSISLYLKAKDKAQIISFSGILGTLVTCLCNILLLLFIKLGIYGYMISIMIGLIIQFLFQFIFGKVYLDYHFIKYKDLSKEMILYSFPLIFNSIAWWINNASDRFIIVFMLGSVANGIYAIAYKIPTILITFQSIFYNAWSISAISEFDKEDSDGFIGKNYISYCFLSIIVCSILMIFNIPIASFLYSNDFFEAWKCVPTLLLATVFNGISQFEGSLFAATKKTREVSLSTVIGAIINIVLNIILIKHFGIIGASVSTLISYIVTWILRTILLKKFVTMKVIWKKHILIIIIIIIQSIFATLNLLKNIQILCLVLIICTYNKELKNLIKKITKK